VLYISTYTLGKFVLAEQTAVGSRSWVRLSYYCLRWDDTTTIWSRLGTLSVNYSNGTLVILVRRLA
jgi:hypothetical protein